MRLYKGGDISNPIAPQEVLDFLLDNTSVSFETVRDGFLQKVLHFEGGDFTYEVHATRNHATGKWGVHKVEVIEGEVKG